MKKIYTVTLDGEDCLSGRFRDNIRIIASMVYDQIYNYVGEGVIPLNINNHIVYNNLHCGRYLCPGYYGDSNYKLDSDIYDDGYINYEPFIVGKRTFGMTIIDDSFDITIIEKIVQYVLNLLKVNYKVAIEIFPYESKNINDESHRDAAMNQIYDKYSYYFMKRSKLVRLFKKSSCRNNKVSTYGR